MAGFDGPGAIIRVGPFGVSTVEPMPANIFKSEHSASSLADPIAHQTLLQSRGQPVVAMVG